MSPDPRDWFASHLNIGVDRKAEIYRELSKSAALGDAVYWLQLLFGSGIATLGLVLDSPAVIIGAMLISPLLAYRVCGLSTMRSQGAGLSACTEA